MANVWLSDAIKYEREIRNKSVRDLCNKKEVEQLRYTLRVALEQLQAVEQGLHLTGGILSTSEPLSPLKPGTGVEYLSHQPTSK